MSGRVLITGASGRIGLALRSRLARPGRTLRLLDVAAPEPGDGVEVLTGTVTDTALMDAACAGVDAVVHLGGIPSEAPWEEILDVNVHGTRTVLEAAARAGVPRVVLASSNHATGMTPVEPDLPADVALRPDTYYGVSKVAMEALGALYADRRGLDVTSLRIGTCAERPRRTRDLATWLSFDDCARLVEACLAHTGPPAHRVVWGMSANTRGFASPAAGAAIGYRPQDDAEVFAPDVSGDDEPLVGGMFTRFPLGERS
ncbi:NAD(P)-dependent oxidoreductase [Pseudonocardia sp.]|jgi:uronate dehydrogenase|uniref:NAD-dependent epimerase/dehydratase family protein n=1 Tax=Pseudonocardia sp. TaxID=60912 RepID=UPI0026093ADC|nr:NAD(P)-dependent oxidoreductase [Pseudonocardia sp.]MCW2717237.1 NAD-dependent epimerase/dehydratase [Pseudonocardia sp.]MDT7618990.1 uronate dehydrogenase [Pseudonocardiales bacterium]